jgi:hypothetical protein
MILLKFEVFNPFFPRKTIMEKSNHLKKFYLKRIVRKTLIAYISSDGVLDIKTAFEEIAQVM